MAARNSFSQYFLLRNGASAPVSSLDGMQMLGLDIMNQQQENYLKQFQQNVDPFLVYDAVQTDGQGNMINTNKIGSLLGVAQLNNPSQYVPPANLINSAVSSYNPQNMPGLEELTSNLTLSPSVPQQMMGQQMMPQQMMPQQMMGQQMMPQQMMPQQIDNSMLKNIASLGNIPRFA